MKIVSDEHTQDGLSRNPQVDHDRLVTMAQAVSLGDLSVRDYHNERARLFGESNFIDHLLVPLFAVLKNEIRRLTGRAP